ncbi:uncharacterized protein LOC131627730 [Vicia villosa]|uniref:uncharacterized protein LOC131627730 n=1 Tax=Vicia villosa TaxID=3911 RepID=UPI00273C1762|nr:uncharacterized protein LOC131627730 [Vicia villosa]
MNKSLLLKWKWRILKEDNAIWSRFLLLRYRNPKFKVLASSGEVLNRDDSSWWKDIILNDFKKEDSVDGFNDWVICDFKQGNTILFWHSSWLGDQTLRESFPLLFDLSTNKLCKVSEAISWNNGVFSWNLGVPMGIDGLDSLGPNLLHQPTNGTSMAISLLMRDLKVLLDRITPNTVDYDDFHWKLTSNGVFSVASVSSLVSNSKDIAWPSNTIKLLDVMWKANIPKKVKIFSWRFFIKRLPLKDLLAYRGINLTSLDCPFCSYHPESSEHLFFQCQITKTVWEKIYPWLGNDLEFSLEEFKSFGCIQEKAKKSNIRVN